MKIRTNRSREKNVKGLLNSESAASTVIAAVLLLSIIFTIFAVVRIAYVPEWKTDAEQLHMSEVQRDMTELKSTVDTITFLTALNPNYSVYPYPVTVPFSMGGGEIPILEPSKSSGTLSVNTEDFSMIITANCSGEKFSETVSQGAITYSSNNRQYVDKNLTYENGALILDQDGRSVMKQLPSFKITKYGHYIFIPAISITGSNDSISSNNNVFLSLIGSSPKNIPLENIDSLNFTIITKYPNVWKSYLNETATKAELVYDRDFIISQNSSSRQVYFNFTSIGVKRINRLNITKSDIKAELGIGSSSIYTSPDSKSATNVAFAYITNYGSNDVSVIDTETNTVTATVNVGNNPTGVAVTPDGTNVYVANQGTTGTVSVIDTTNNTVTSKVNVGNSPWGVAVNPAGTKVYVAHQGGSNDVFIIYTANNTVETRVRVGSNPSGVAVTPDGTKVYVTNSGKSNSPGKTVTVIDTKDNNNLTTLTVGSTPLGVAVNPAGTKAYVTNAGNDNVSVIDITNNKVIGPSVNVGDYPEGVAVTPDGTKVYVANYNDGTVSVINTATNTVTTTVKVGTGPTGVAINKDGTIVYIANSGTQDIPGHTVSVIDTTTNTVTAEVTVGDNPIAFGQFIVSPPM